MVVHQKILYQSLFKCRFDEGDCGENCDTAKLGDGTCDFINNYVKCNFDGGDCEEPSDHVDLSNCQGNINWVGDDFCDVQLVTEECNFDGGDCGVGYCITKNWGDDYCDPGMNIPECDFDGGDCEGY